MINIQNSTYPLHYVDSLSLLQNVRVSINLKSHFFISQGYWVYVIAPNPRAFQCHAALSELVANLWQLKASFSGLFVPSVEQLHPVYTQLMFSDLTTEDVL